MSTLEDEFVCFDLETTGLSCRKHSIIEVGCVRFSTKQGFIDTFKSLVYFDGEIDEIVINLTGIREEMLVDSPKIDVVLRKFIHFIGDTPLLSHNAPFDARFISHALYNNDFNYPKNKIYDTISIFKKLLPKLPSYKLQNLNKTFNIHPENTHRALDDAKATSNLFLLAAKQNIAKTAYTNISTLAKAIYFKDYDLNKKNCQPKKPNEPNEPNEPND